MRPNVRIDMDNFVFGIKGDYTNGNIYMGTLIPRDKFPEHKKSPMGKIIAKAIELTNAARQNRFVVKIELNKTG